MASVFGEAVKTKKYGPNYGFASASGSSSGGGSYAVDVAPVAKNTGRPISSIGPAAVNPTANVKNDADFLKALWSKGGYNPDDVVRVKAMAANGNALAKEWLKYDGQPKSAYPTATVAPKSTAPVRNQWGGMANAQQLISAGFNPTSVARGAVRDDPTVQAAKAWGPITYDQNTGTYNQAYYDNVLGRVQQTKSVSWQEGSTPVQTFLGSTDAGAAKQVAVNNQQNTASGGMNWSDFFSNLMGGGENSSMVKPMQSTTTSKKATVNKATASNNKQTAALKKRGQENYDKTVALRGQSSMKMTRP